MFGLLIMIVVLLTDLISGIHTNIKKGKFKTGFGGLIWNKGAVIIEYWHKIS